MKRKTYYLRDYPRFLITEHKGKKLVLSIGWPFYITTSWWQLKDMQNPHDHLVFGTPTQLIDFVQNLMASERTEWASRNDPTPVNLAQWVQQNNMVGEAMLMAKILEVDYHESKG